MCYTGAGPAALAETQPAGRGWHKKMGTPQGLQREHGLDPGCVLATLLCLGKGREGKQAGGYRRDFLIRGELKDMTYEGQRREQLERMEKAGGLFYFFRVPWYTAAAPGSSSCHGPLQAIPNLPTSFEQTNIFMHSVTRAHHLGCEKWIPADPHEPPTHSAFPAPVRLGKARWAGPGRGCSYTASAEHARC